MNSKERIDAVVALETPDRVPVGPLIDHFAATYTGITYGTLMRDGDKRIAAVLKTMADLGPWDISFVAELASGPLMRIGLPPRLKQPGIELDENEIHQFEESELLIPDDYDYLVKKGFIRFNMRFTRRKYPKYRGLSVPWITMRSTIELRKHRKLIEKAGAQMACGALMTSLFDYFSMGRGIPAISMDIFDRPDKIKSASRVWAKQFTALSITGAKIVGCPRIFVGFSRSSPAFMSPRHFEEFVLPEVEYIINTIVDAGLTPLIHADTDWTKNFPLFRKFPKAKCILELDGHSDIFKAKEILGDHMCIMGDVPAYLLAFSTKDEVLDYCKRLIMEVGKGGGFILSSGCSIPAKAKPENVKAMAEAVEEWGWYK